MLVMQRDEVVESVAYSPGGRVATMGHVWGTTTRGRQQRKVARFHLWDRATGQKIRSVKMNTNGPGRCVAISPNGRLLVTGNGRKRIHIRGGKTGRKFGQLSNPCPNVLGMGFTADGTSLFTGSADRKSNYARGTLARYRIPDPNCAAVDAECDVWGGPMYLLAVAPAGDLVAIGSTRHDVALFRPDAALDRWPEHSDRLHIPVKTLRAMTFSPDGVFLAVTEGRDVGIWDLAYQARRTRLSGHKRVVNCLAYSPDGRAIATGAGDGTVRIWDAESGEQMAVFDWGITEVLCVAFSPDGTTCAAGGKGGVTLVVWDVED